MNSWITLADAVDAICKHFHKGYIDIKQRDTLLAQALGFEHLKSPPEGIVPIAREYIPEARYRSKRRK